MAASFLAADGRVADLRIPLKKCIIRLLMENRIEISLNKNVLLTKKVEKRHAK